MGVQGAGLDVQLSRIRHQSWETWKQAAGETPFCWHTACCISLLRVVREYFVWSRVGVAKHFGLAVPESPEYGSKLK